MNNELFMLFSVLCPYAMVAAGALAALLSWIYFKDRPNYKVTSYIASMFLIAAYAFLLSWNGAYGTVINLNIMVSPSVSFLTGLIIFITLFSVISASNRVKEPEIKAGEYYSFLLTLCLGAMLMISAKDALTVFLSLELLSMSIYALTGITATHNSAESALKYFILGSFASVFMLMGLALIYGSTGTLEYGGIRAAIFLSYPGKTLIAGILFMLVGFMFKIALVPFHFWTPDVYEGAPTQVSAIMASVIKTAGVAAMLNLFINAADTRIMAVTAFFASFTMLFANIMALPQKNVKRMLAYSSISHAGYLILGFLILESWQVFFYLLVYSLATFGAFTIVMLLEKKENGLEVEEFNGLFTKNPLLSFSMAIFLFSLAGVPPMAGFFGKFYLFSAAIKAGWLWPTVIAVISSAISLYYYLKVIVAMFMKDSSESETCKISPNGYLTVSIFAALTLTLGFFSTPLIEILTK
ncbi:MAG: NADH-quinone oxidoreductase subunit N [Elusimicrobiota bacterium]